MQVTGQVFCIAAHPDAPPGMYKQFVTTGSGHGLLLLVLGQQQQCSAACQRAGSN